MKNNYLPVKAVLVLLLFTTRGHSQTFFESAEGDGVIAFRDSTVSQIKLNLSSTAITYGYYYVGGNAVDPYKFVSIIEVKAKPNEDGIATLVKTGRLQPGFQLNGAAGVRFNDVLFNNFFSILDIYIKPEFKLNGYTIYDETKNGPEEEKKYKVTRGFGGCNFLVNYCMSPWAVNFFLGAEIGIKSSSNIDDLAEGSIQTSQLVPGTTNQFVFSDVESVNIGVFKKTTAAPFKVDVILDPGLQVSPKAGTTTGIAGFGYYRTDLKQGKHRLGAGICLLDARNPSRVFSSLGYEFPVSGKDVTADDRKKDKGIVFVSIGYTIF